MKNKVIALLLLTIVSFCLDAHAIARLSCQGLLGATGLGMSVSYYLYRKEVNEAKILEVQSAPGFKEMVKEGGVELPSDAYREIKDLFKRHGFPIEFEKWEEFKGKPVSSMAVRKIFPTNKVILFFSPLDVTILGWGELSVCQGKKRAILTKDHLIGVVGHEIDHLKYDDQHNLVEKFYNHWYYKDWLGDVFLRIFKHKISKEESAYRRAFEERSDKNATYNVIGREGDPEMLAYYCEKLVEYMRFFEDKEKTHLERIKNNKDYLDMVERRSHPFVCERIDYLTKLAAELRRQAGFRQSRDVEEQRKTLLFNL